MGLGMDFCSRMVCGVVSGAVCSGKLEVRCSCDVGSSMNFVCLKVIC